jgi:hypothetical protein
MSYCQEDRSKRSTVEEGNMPKINQPVLERIGAPMMVYRVESMSRPGRFHYVFHWGSAKGITCTCEAATFGHHCKHVDMVPLCRVEHAQERVYSDGISIAAIECGLPEHHGGKHSWER